MKRNVYAFLTFAVIALLAQTAIAQLAWSHHGPEALGNRTRSIVFGANNTLFAASAGGGIYQSTNKGKSWARVSGYNGNPTVTALARNGNTLYAGTGEIEFLNDVDIDPNLDWDPNDASGTPGYIGLPGTGVYVSTDNGATWSNDNATTKDFPTLSYEGPFLGVQKITVGEGGRVFVATGEGLYYSDDDFQSITKADGPDKFKDNLVWDIETSGSTVFAGNELELYISSDNGSSFSKVEVDPNAETFAQVRVEIAVSPDNGDVVYAGRSGNGNVQFRGVFRSNDRGQTWAPYSPSGSTGFSPLGNNSRSNFAMAVRPGDPDALIVTGSRWYIYDNEVGWNDNGIQHFNPTLVNLLTPGKYLPRPIYTVTFNPDQPGEVYVGTGTDIMRSEDNGNTFFPVSAGYGSSNLYRVGVFGVEGDGGERSILAGSESHGVIKNANYWKNQITPDTDPADIDSTWSPATNRFGTIPGVGGVANSVNASDVSISYIYPGSVVLEGADQGLIKSDGTYGGGLSEFYSLPLNTDTILRPSTGVVDSVIYQSLDGITDNSYYINRSNPTAEPGGMIDNSPAYPLHAFTLDEHIPANYVAPGNATMAELMEYPDRDSIQKLPHYLYYTSSRFVWLVNYTFGSPEGLNPRWDRITNDLTDRLFTEYYTCITPVGDGTDALFVGTSRGKIFRIEGAPDFANYDATLEGPNVIEVTSDDRVLVDYQLTMLGRWITDIAVNPDNPEQIAVTFGGYGGPDPLGYVWIINDASSQNPEYISMFPGPGTNDFEIAYSADFVKDPQTDETMLLVGTESGLYSTKDIIEQPTWTTELPSSYGTFPVYDIFVRKYKTVIVNEHTGDFRLQQDNTVFLASHGNGVWSTSDLRFGGRDGEEEEDLVFVDPSVKLYPNPTEKGTSATISVELPADAQVRTAVYTVDGRQVAQLRPAGFLAGKHEIEMPEQGLQPGLYIVEVQITDAKQTRTESFKWVIK